MIRMLTANLDFATGPAKDKPQIEHLYNVGGKRSVLFFQEAKNLKLAKLLRNLKDLVVHQDISSAALAGTALATRGVTLNHYIKWLGGDTPATLPRWVRQATLNEWSKPIECLSVHIFPHRAGRAAQQRYVIKLRRKTLAAHRAGKGWIIGTDANMPITQLAHQLGGIAYGKGIVGFVVSRNIDVAAYGLDYYGIKNHATDHPAVWIDVRGIK